MPRKPARTATFPSKDDILRFIAESPTPVGKREVGRAFALHGADKIALKSLLKDMVNDGLIESGAGRALHKAGGLPKVTVLRVTDIDDSGSAVAVPERWESDAPAPRIRVIERTRKGALGVGERFLARIEERGQGPETGSATGAERGGEDGENYGVGRT